jgi:hypothetical protein
VAYLHNPCECFQLRNRVAESEGGTSKEN